MWQGGPLTLAMLMVRAVFLDMVWLKTCQTQALLSAMCKGGVV